MRTAVADAIGVGLRGVSSGNAAVINTVTPVTVKGGVVRVIDSATGDIARTTSGDIEDTKYGWYVLRDATGISAEFDSAVTRTGRLTVKLSTTDATGRLIAYSMSGSTVPSPRSIIIKPSTAYKLTCYVKTTNVVSNGAYIQSRTLTSAGASITNTASNKLTGDNDWSLLTVYFTSDANASFLTIMLLNDVAGNISDAWFDVNSMTLEEVSSITNSGSFPALYYPKATAVTSTDNIDQSQVVSDNTNQLGSVAASKNAQQFLPTKKNLTGVVIRRGTETGTYTGNVTVTLEADSSSNPSGTPLATTVISNATWLAITTDTDYTVALPYTLTVDGSTKYWIVLTSSTSDASNYTRVRVANSKPYTAGLYKNWNGSTWGSDITTDSYFKTLYSKNTDNFTVATDTQTLSVTAPTVDGWANGTIIDTSDGTYGVTPLTLAVGANNVYFSSNGPNVADGKVDPSLQSTIGGQFIT